MSCRNMSAGCWYAKYNGKGPYGITTTKYNERYVAFKDRYVYTDVLKKYLAK